MLPKSQRLRIADFKKFRGAQVFHTPHFLLRVKPMEQNTSSRYAAIVSGAISKKAVVRNLLRRRIYSIVEGHRWSSERPHFLTITAKKGTPALSFELLRKELTEVLLKTQAIR